MSFLADLSALAAPKSASESSGPASFRKGQKQTTLLIWEHAHFTVNGKFMIKPKSYIFYYKYCKNSSWSY